MTEPNRTEAASAAAIQATAVAAIFREAEHWTRAQCELLNGIETLWTDWMQRQRAAFDASAGAMQQMSGCRNLIDLMQLQQAWLARAVRRSASDTAASFAAVAAGSDEPAGSRPQPARTIVPTTAAEQRQAAE